MGKCAKVLSLYLGDRRLFPSNRSEVLSVLTLQIQFHKHIDPGYPTDLILVNHNSAGKEDPDILNYEEEKISQGIIRTLNRPRISADVSFGSYKYAYFKFKDEYEYWFFCEDDILTIKKNVVEDMLELLKGDVGFVGALDVGRGHQYNLKDGCIVSTGHNEKIPHIHGGVGLTSTDIIERVVKQNPEFLMTPNIIQDSPSLRSKTLEKDYTPRLEEEFTNVFVRSGFKLKYLEGKEKFIRLQNVEFC